MTAEKLDAAKRLHAEGRGGAAIARALSLGRTTIYRHLAGGNS